MTLQELESQVLNLPEASRAQLAEKLLQSLEEEENREVELAWIEEAKRRREELRRDPSLGIPVEKVLARLRTTT